MFVLSVTLVCCGQTAGWIKMPLGMEVGLVPVHTVLDVETQLPPQQLLPTFPPMSIVATRSPISATAEIFYKVCVAFNT